MSSSIVGFLNCKTVCTTHSADTLKCSKEDMKI